MWRNPADLDIGSGIRTNMVPRGVPAPRPPLLAEPVHSQAGRRAVADWRGRRI